MAQHHQLHRAIVLAFSALLLLLLAAVPPVDGHGCPAFTIANLEERDSVLNKDTKLIPQDIQEFPSSYPSNTTFYGVYDCHKDMGNYEVGMAAICTNNTDNPQQENKCICVAKYQFEDCASCTLHYDQDDKDDALSIDSFSADCRGIEVGLADCTVEQGFQTNGCFLSGTDATTITTAGGGAGKDFSIGGSESNSSSSTGGDSSSSSSGGVASLGGSVGFMAMTMAMMMMMMQQ